MQKRGSEIPNHENHRAGFIKRIESLLVLCVAVGFAKGLLPPVVHADNGGPLPVTIAQSEPKSPSATPPLQRFSLGQVLYLRHCADCHGWEGRGDGPLAAILAAKPRNLHAQSTLFAQNTDAQIAARILYGTPLMKLSSKTLPYSEEEMTELAAYLQQLPTIKSEEITRGKDGYDSLCAACHGLFGRGDGLATRSKRTRLPDFVDRT